MKTFVQDDGVVEVVSVGFYMSTSKVGTVQVGVQC